MNIYLAGPLFSEAERNYLKHLKVQIEDFAHKLGKDLSVCWPWELFRPGEIESLGCDAPKEIFRRCRDAVDQCDIVLAWLDGTQVDDGTAWEVGYAYAHGKRIIGIRTDLRRAGECEGSHVNAMIEGCCVRIVKSTLEFYEFFCLEICKARYEGIRDQRKYEGWRHEPAK